MTKIAVVNLAWLDSYDGSQTKAENTNFRYLKEGGKPHEAYNFKETPSGYYAYFAHRAHLKGKGEEQKYKQDKEEYRKIKIERLGGNNNDNEVSNVFVIFVSTKPKETGKETGRWIVGYYENADVYRKPQEKDNPNISKDGRPIIYFFHSKTAKEYPSDDRLRPFPITGSGFMGQSPIWYPDLSDPKVKSIIREMLSSINKLDILNETLEEIREDEDKATANSFDNDEQRKIRLFEKENKLPQEEVRQVKFFKRDEDVKAEVLKNAKGICAKCKKEAPFIREHGALKGKPYLEIHHKIWLSEGGKDNVKNAVALCPNCHREEHCGKRFWKPS